MLIWLPSRATRKSEIKSGKLAEANGLKGAGNSKATKVVNTQKQAIERVEQIARNQQSDTKVHSRDGKIRAGNSYGNDPHPPKDKK